MEWPPTESDGEAFMLGDLWRSSIFAIPGEGPVVHKLQQIGTLCGDMTWVELKTTEGDLFAKLELTDVQKSLDWRLPSELRALEPHVAPSCVSEPAAESSEHQAQSDQDEAEFDFLKETSDELVGTRNVLSWEVFNKTTVRRKIVRLSDLGSDGWDAAINHTIQEKPSKLRVIQREVARKGLVLLGMGFESLLFVFNTKENAFHLRQPEIRMVSVSDEIFQSLISEVANCGLQFKRIYQSTGRLSVSKQLPTMHALISAITLVTEELHRLLLQNSTACKSLIRLQSMYQRPAQILESLNKLISTATKPKNDAGILASVYDYVEVSASTTPWIYTLLQQVLRQAALPWLATASMMVGLASEMGSNRRLGRAMLEQAESILTQEYEEERPDVMPRFLEQNDKLLILESCACLNMLRRFDDRNLLALHSRYQRVQPPLLVWSLRGSTLQEIEQLSERYDTSLVDLLHNDKFVRMDRNDTNAPPDGITQERNLFNIPSEDMPGFLAASMTEIEDFRTTNVAFIEDLAYETQCAVRWDASQTRSTHLYPLNLGIHLSISPVLKVQHRHLNQACLRMLFDKFKIKEHFLVHYRYSLMGDGLFTARLSEALFSLHASSTDHRSTLNSSGHIGLRLEDRKTWPPGGPELRLALMDILSENYFGPTTAAQLGSRELPGNLSFGIRNLPDAEIEAVMDATSLNALDFLRLKYTSTSPLDTVFTTGALEKYDAIFKLLLRIARILALLKQLTPTRRTAIAEDPTATKFRIAALRFMEALSAHFLQSGIAAPWLDFLSRVTNLEQELSDNGIESRSGIQAVTSLSALHDQMLDSIVFALLLRRRQQPVMRLLEEIFCSILSFAKVQTSVETAGYQDSLSNLLHLLREKVGIFIEVSRGLSGKKAYMAGVKLDGKQGADSGLEHLISRLEMNGWWASGQERS